MKVTLVGFFLILLMASVMPKRTQIAFNSTNSRPPLPERAFVSVAVEEVINNIAPQIKDAELRIMFENCLPNTLDTTVRFLEQNGTYDTFVVTGDINAMWLRDSTNQVLPYISLINYNNSTDTHLQNMIKGLINRQVKCVLLDPFANAFNFDQAPSQWLTDTTYKKGFLNTQVPAMTFHLHERKYELDSLCAFFKLSYQYFYHTNKDLSPFDSNWLKAVEEALKVIKLQQEPQGTLNPTGGSGYYFQRTTTAPTDTLLHGVGSPAKRTGMSSSPFRPSDDASALPYPTAANAMAVVTINHLIEILNDLSIGHEQPIVVSTLINFARNLADEINNGISQYSVMNHPVAGDVYAYEVDGFGNGYFMDDANIPSLLSLPYLGFTSASDPTYQRTRAFLLSNNNPYFFSGSAGEGIGGPHVGMGYIWPMSIIIRALTSTDDNEIIQCLNTLKSSTAGTGFMHESFFQDNSGDYTRPWFAWANSLFGELILYLAKYKPHLIYN